MRYLIDTNILIFSLGNESHYIDKNVMAILSDAENTLYVSSSCVFEAINLYQTGRIDSSFKTVHDFLDAINTGFSLIILHSKKEHFDTFANLPTIKGHNDPVDRTIIAQSITEKIPLISSDAKFKEYKQLDLIFNDKRAR